MTATKRQAAAERHRRKTMEKIEIQAIRRQLKNRLPEFKFSVRQNDARGVFINIMSGPEDFSEIINGKNGPNIYEGTPHAYPLTLRRVMAIAKTAPHSVGGPIWYDNSDPTSDYFEQPYLISIRLGRDDLATPQPYQCTI